MIAIAMLLADIAGDFRRDDDVRKRAEASLGAMTTQHVLEAGLSGDYAEAGIRLLRIFHLRGADRDPATSSQSPVPPTSPAMGYLTVFVAFTDTLVATLSSTP